jgi:hypothetical protein
MNSHIKQIQIFKNATANGVTFTRVTKIFVHKNNIHCIVIHLRIFNDDIHLYQCTAVDMINRILCCLFIGAK